MKKKFSIKEQEEIVAAMQKAFIDSSFSAKISELEYLISQWKKIAYNIKTGYDLTIDDYMNDLDLRFFLDLLLNELKGDLRDKIYSLIAEADKQSFESTKSPKNKNKQIWHWREQSGRFARIPVNMPDRLKASFKKYDLE